MLLALTIRVVTDGIRTRCSFRYATAEDPVVNLKAWGCTADGAVEPALALGGPRVRKKTRMTTLGSVEVASRGAL